MRQHLVEVGEFLLEKRRYENLVPLCTPVSSLVWQETFVFMASYAKVDGEEEIILPFVITQEKTPV